MNENSVSDVEDKGGISLLDIIQTLAESARLLVYGPLVTALLAVGIAYWLGPSYVARTSIMTPQQQSSAAAAALSQLGSLAGLAGGGLKSPAEMYIGLLQSRTVADRMVDRFGILQAEGIKDREDARKLLARISAFTARRDGQITIGVASRNPSLSADIANAYVEELSNMTAHLAVTEAQQRRLFYEKEMVRAKDNLAQAEIELGKAGVSESVVKFNPAVLGEGLATLKARIAAKEVQISTMRGYLTQNSPDYRLALQELAALRAQVAKEGRDQTVGGSGAEYIKRFRNFKYYETLFEQLARQYEAAKIDESSEGAIIQVVDKAIPPEKKANMSTVLVAAIGWLLGALALLIFVLVRRLFFSAGADPERAAKMVAIRAGLKRVVMR